MTLRATGFVLLLGLVSAGCSDSGSGSTVVGATAAATSSASSPTTPTTSPTTPPPPRQPLVGAWYTGDLHSHSATYSDDARRQGGDPIDVTVRVAEQAGLDFLAGTDHRTNDVLTDPTFTSQTMVLLRGMEWGGAMHAGAIGQNAPVQENTTQSGAALVAEIDTIIGDVQQKGGIFVLNHPGDPEKLWVVEPQAFDAIEVWNSQWSMTAFQPATQSDLDSQMSGLGLTQAGIAPSPQIVDAVADQRGSFNLQALTLYESYLNSGRRLAAVGGGDRHMLFHQGRPTTHVYATDRTQQGILDGVRAGRTYISRTRTGPLVDFTADEDGDGVYEALIGDDVASSQQVSFRIVVEGAPGGRVDLVKRGVVIRSEPILAQTHVLIVNDTPSAGDWYRVDVYESIPMPIMQREGLLLQAAQASGKTWAVLLALMNMVPSSSIQTNWGTLLPTLLLPDDIDKLLNASIKDPGYSRGAITSAIYTR